MAESILFLTGHLARPRLEAVLEGMKASFAWKVLDIGVKVAALMTEEIIARRLPNPVEADKIMLPGRCRADLDRLSERFGVPFVRGPDELKDIPGYFGRAAKASDMTKYDIQIFAEIVDASALSIEAILARAEDYVRKGANVIDLGGLPDTPFPHLEQAVKALKAKGYRVSVDSADPEELLRGGKAGADFLLSLNEDTLAIADQVKSTPVLIPKEHGDLPSLYRAMDALDAKGRAYLADPVLDPINFGFMQSLERYAQVRRDRPKGVHGLSHRSTRLRLRHACDGLVRDVADHANGDQREHDRRDPHPAVLNVPEGELLQAGCEEHDRARPRGEAEE
jgi:hypothetical protein